MKFIKNLWLKLSLCISMSTFALADYAEAQREKDALYGLTPEILDPDNLLDGANMRGHQMIRAADWYISGAPIFLAVLTVMDLILCLKMVKNYKDYKEKNKAVLEAMSAEDYRKAQLTYIIPICAFAVLGVFFLTFGFWAFSA